MSRPSLVEQELALLRYIVAQGPVTVGEVTEGFGRPHNLARSTIKTVMDRLEKKGYLARQKAEGVFRYHAAVTQTDLLKGQIREFIEKKLAGSVSPFVTYLTEKEAVSDEELAALQRLVARLRAKREEQK